MHIGGKTSRAVLDQLRELTDEFTDRSDDLDADFTQAHFSVASERNYGDADELTQFCQENKLTFHLSWAGVAGCFEAGIKYWNPMLDQIIEHEAEGGGEPIMSFYYLIQKKEAGANLEEITAEMQRARVIEVPRLEWVVSQFEISALPFL